MDCPLFRYCDFFDSRVDGHPMNVGDRPLLSGENNIAWPIGWTAEMANEYRKSHGLEYPSD